ncbi:hypothetical protein [Maribacter aurantiacus]|uniref:hypothetical protein n=1 Tax=Maribacter aurantiacus TaxID=1882343 RepID=UPI001375998E|nr:hypothetical protein [Maribacter aurantiacus]
MQLGKNIRTGNPRWREHDARAELPLIILGSSTAKRNTETVLKQSDPIEKERTKKYSK